MIKKILKFILWTLGIILGLAIILLIYFNIPVAKENADAKLGVTFSSRYAGDIMLNWKEAYIAMLDDLGVKKVRIPIYWDLVEKQEGQYDFSDIAWQLDEAKKRNADVILVVGQKVPRWPECAIPEWAKNDDQKRKGSLLKFIDKAIDNLKSYSNIEAWQVENEPFLSFGICPALDTNLLDSEIALVKAKDPSRPVIVTDSGELSLWIQAAKRADIFGTTMYRTIYKKGLGYFDYPIGPRFFWFKHWLIKTFANQDRAIVIELQAEPWISGYTTECPLDEQFKSMNKEKLVDNVSFARRVGFPEMYLWGVEWWYWLKVEKDHPELWNSARELFNGKSVVK
ncbi:MAG: hypothetical protein WCV59_04300 [Parcubacteria group bacterium]|jgi:hypothetical protein